MSLDIGVLLPRDLPADQVLPYARRADALGFAELWVVEDLGSTNGTFLGGVRVGEPARIEPGVPVRVGRTVLELRR